MNLNDRFETRDEELSIVCPWFEDDMINALVHHFDDKFYFC